MNIPFGKHKGKTVEEVFNTDRGYLVWWLDKLSSEINDPQWGESNKRRYEELKGKMARLDGAPIQSMAVNNVKDDVWEAQKGKEKMEIAEKIGNHNLSDVYSKVKNIDKLSKKLDLLTIKLDEIYNEIAVVKWFVEGKTEPVPTKKASKPEDIEWTE